ncbi:Cytosolic 5' nucleotidase III [Fasciolopsis buskii]|uniref:5'-nucleotidase n=1 Tax=Fasciolopsis buskii TaxID=27845 RepID=A0A8E0RLZ0_9TREM|nr:Cytosolic 5' nucleotidase III [Fasciolopsis buski]
MRVACSHACAPQVDKMDNHEDTVFERIKCILNLNTLDSHQIHLGDVERTWSKLESMRSAGPDSLEVISDFDHTMSKFRENGVKIPSCHGIFEMDPEVTESTRNKLKALTERYLPIEFDPVLPVEDKIPHMIDWWSTAHQIIVDCGLHRKALQKTVCECNLVLRDKVKEFTDLLSQNHIPLLIFSAGLGDVIQLLLQRFSMDTNNVRVVSNFMRFNNEDILVGFEEPIIHTFNKTAASIPEFGIAGGAATPRRTCVLLLGDSTGDVHMADGATVDDPEGVCGTVLRIGFLNDQVEKNLDVYKSLYDIVLVDHATFSVPLAIVRYILRQTESPETVTPVQVTDPPGC